MAFDSTSIINKIRIFMVSSCALRVYMTELRVFDSFQYGGVLRSDFSEFDRRSQMGLFTLAFDIKLILLGWLDFQTLGKLDTAMTNREERRGWLQSLAATKMSTAADSWHFDDPALLWIIRRQIALRSLRVSSGYRRLSDNINLSELLSIMLVSIYPGGYSDIKDDDLGFLRGCPKLNVICLDRCSLISDDGISRIASACPQLHSIFLDSTDITDSSLRNIGENCHHLRVINVSHTKATDKGMCAISQTCPQLRYISLKGCSMITSKGICALCLGCTLLEDVSLDGLDKINNLAMLALGENCPNLHTLSLNGCRGIKYDGISAIASGCPRLLSVSLDECCWLSDSCIHALQRGCPLLQSISLNHTKVTNAITCTIGEGWSNLKSISLNECNLLTDVGIKAIANACHELESISIAFTKVTDASMYALGLGCPHLHSIRLDGCEGVTESGISALRSGCIKLSPIVLKPSTILFSPR